MNITPKTHKSILRKIIVVTGFVLVILFVTIIVIVLTQKPKELQISNVNIDTISDGVYTGSADNGLVKATVTVKVDKGKMQNITISEHETLLGKKAEKITDNIISQQSLEVDAISSATYSSDTLRKAIENALRKGEKR